MANSYAKHFNTKVTPQSQAIPGRESEMVRNSAGGFTFSVDDFGRLDRFLILGSEGGSYYASEKTLTKENAQGVIACIKKDGLETVRRIVDVSVNGRAPKNDPAIFALALCATFGDTQTKQAAADAVAKVCRIGTHLFQFAEAIEALRGWGRSVRRAVGGWYASKDPRDLSYQAIKYQQRNGWSHRDLLRLSHPNFSEDEVRNAVAHWMVKGWPGVGDEPHPTDALLPIWAFERAKLAKTEQEIVRLIREYRLPREAIPTQFLNSPAVWEALLEDMPITALVRNLGKMTAIGLLGPLSNATNTALSHLGDADKLIRGRVHPLALLVALKTYAQGHGEKGSLTWSPVQSIVNALDAGFYTAFQAVRPTGKRWMMGLDVSGSMTSGQISGMTGITPRIGSAAMALITANVEQQHMFTGFTSGAVGGRNVGGISELSISPRQRLDDVIRYMSGMPFGGTDCSLPMLYAMQRKLPVDVFAVFTDSETYAGRIQPVQALKQYRETMGIDAKLIVVGMVSSGFSIADPTDAGMLDVVGFDLAAPNIMSEFVGYNDQTKPGGTRLARRAS